MDELGGGVIAVTHRPALSTSTPDVVLPHTFYYHRKSCELHTMGKVLYCAVQNFSHDTNNMDLNRVHFLVSTFMMVLRE